ncbi:CAP domain-containing protein [Burkholderia sp. Ac-20365]|uniref:CAP domain-containing protein n=1 Tax=Burkholderia sp. Ac-20365 TaxID=2703897 RepID=UPI001F11C067|nr:CAP domain-containing protein [Burkholderia sp. Ac-20365]
MILKNTLAVSLSLAVALLTGCASPKPVAKAAIPYDGPIITLRPAPGPSAVTLRDGPETSLDYVNDRRAELGLLPILPDDDVAAAAADHARYLDANRANGHDELEGKPGFTGADVNARVRLRTPTFGSSEVLAVYGGAHAPVAPIEEIWDAPFHRGSLLLDWKRAGEASLNGDNATVIVVDFADFNRQIADT